MHPETSLTQHFSPDFGREMNVSDFAVKSSKFKVVVE